MTSYWMCCVLCWVIHQVISLKHDSSQRVESLQGGTFAVQRTRKSVFDSHTHSLFRFEFTSPAVMDFVIFSLIYLIYIYHSWIGLYLQSWSRRRGVWTVPQCAVTVHNLWVYGIYIYMNIYLENGGWITTIHCQWGVGTRCTHEAMERSCGEIFPLKWILVLVVTFL